MIIAKRTGLIIILIVTFTVLVLFHTRNLGSSEFSRQTSSTTLAAPNEENPRYRIRLDFIGKCIGSSDGYHLDFLFCDPTQEQTFNLLKNGHLKFTRTGLCVSLHRHVPAPGPLTLGDCSTGASFNYVNGSFLKINDTSNHRGSKLCLSVSGNKVRHSNSTPDRANKVVLSKCTNSSSRVSMIEETAFIAKRKALLWPMPKNSTDCNFPACGINRRAPPVELLPSSKIHRCSNLSECVTVVIKTARRPHFVLRLAQSLRRVKGYDLPIIAYDDGVDSYSEEIMSKISSFSNLQYIIGEKHDLGISLGRNLAVKLVKTKYFLLCDDDLIFTKQSDIELLAKILDTTDASLVGGSQGAHFAGYFHFTSLNNHDEVTNWQGLNYYQGQCYHVNETIISFPNCMRCDSTSNFFMAKTADILDVGCWSEELKIVEHKDLFLRLKAAGKKVAWCPEVTILNRKAPHAESKNSGYKKLRHDRYDRFETMFKNIWNVHWLQKIMKPNSTTFVKRKGSILN